MKALVNAVLRVPSDLIKTRVVKSYELPNTEKGRGGEKYSSLLSVVI